MIFYLVPTLRKFQSFQIIRNLSVVKHQTVKVEVKPGCVIGRQHLTPNGNVFNSFQGIPYAVPPLGNLRFKSPVPLEQFEEPELDCTKERDMPHQRNPFVQAVSGSENCLFLNIYAPKIENNATPLPVIVYIFGGGFRFGSGDSDSYFPQRFMDENVIVVTLNYRLGALGFLAFPEADIWGNAGLKDQRLALQWIQENISAFNGDANNVTLMGQSAGAASIHLHTYASHANKLFHKAIMQSGTANMEWVFQFNPNYKTRRMAQLFGCESKEPKEILKFLQSEKVTPLGMLEKNLELLTPDERRRGLPLTFKPVIEDCASPDNFINRPICDVLKQPNTLNMPIMMGYDSAEGMAMATNAFKKITEINDDLERFIPRNIPLSPKKDASELKELAKRIRQLYFKGQNIDEQHDALIDLLSDYHFSFDMHIAAEWQVKYQTDAPLYFYVFDYIGERNMYKFFFQFNHLRGACHGDELFYLFQGAREERKLQPYDELCMQRLCRLWANFARYGRPTIGTESSIVDFEWAPVCKPINNEVPFRLDYLYMGEQFKMCIDPDKDRTDFWRNIYKEYPPMDYSCLSSESVL